MPKMTRREIVSGVSAAVTIAALGANLIPTGSRAATPAPLMTGSRLAHEGGDGSFKRVVENGITFGMANDAPYDWFDPSTNKWQGIDYDLITEAAKRLGIAKTTFTTLEADALIPGLVSKRLDFLLQDFHMNPKRLEVMDFTIPVYFYGDGLVVKQGNPKNLHTWEDLAGHTIGAERGENYADWLDKRTDLAGVKLYKSFSEEVQDLINGGVDAIIGEMPVFAYYAKIHPGSIEIATGYTPQTNLADWTRFGLRKEDNDLNNAFCHALADMLVDGTTLAILERYGMSVDNITPRLRA